MPSSIFADVTEPVAIVGLGYVPVRSPPALWLSLTNRASPHVESNPTVPVVVIGLGVQTTPVASLTLVTVPPPPLPMLSFLGAQALPVHFITCPDDAPIWPRSTAATVPSTIMLLVTDDACPSFTKRESSAVVSLPCSRLASAARELR